MANTDNELTGLFEAPLFATAQAPARRGLPAFAVSTTLHGLGIALVSYVLLHNPVIVQNPMSPRYRARQIDFQMQETTARAAEAMYPTQAPAPERNANTARAGAGAQARTIPAEPHLRAVPAITLPDGGSGKLTLLQPELPPHQTLLQALPIPTVMIWKPEVKPALKIVPPARDQATTADAQTSIEVPNEEVKLADLPVAAAPTMPKVPAPAAASASPVAVKTPAVVKSAPATVSAADDQPSPAAILSASDVRMNIGTVVLPPVSETRGTEHKDGGEAPAGGVLGAHAGGSGSGGAAANPAPAAGRAKIADGQGKVPDSQKTSAPASAGTATGQPVAGETAEHIQLPKDGKFGVIVVGSNLSERYPETMQVWTDRTAYTAYLHLGTPKAWILQYAQLRSTDQVSGGAVAKLEAPWPYDIQRPNLLAVDLNADALMVHGVLNESGRLENMAIAYPQGYAHSSFVLRELAQWLFRPALQLGKPTAVEILLIIPEEAD